MGSNRHLKISATGFPGTNETWRFIQSAWREPLNALALLCGDKTVVTGCVVSEGNMSDGFIVLNGELLPFQAGAIGANITMIKEVVNVDYDVDIDNDGNLDNLPAYETRYLRFGSDGESTFPYADLKRLKSVQQLSDYQLPDYLVAPIYVAFTATLLEKLNGIEAGAEVNVQADWNVANSLSDAFIKNKPTGIFTKIERLTYLGMTDIDGSGVHTISIPDMGANNYIVIPSLETGSANPTIARNTASFSYTVFNKTNNSFQFAFREFSALNQSPKIEFLIVLP